jgi:hypothetical protein
MSRPSKDQHILAILRKRIPPAGKPPLSQERFAESVKSKRRTIQDVELRKRPLSVSLAARISRRWDVSETCLLQNDLKGGLRDRKGQPWKSPLLPQSKSKTKSRPVEKISWEILPESALHSRVLTTTILLDQFQNVRDYFEHAVRDQHEAYFQWQFLFTLCFGALDQLQTDGSYHRSNYEDPVEATLGEIHQLKSTLRTWSKRTQKMESKMDAPASESLRTLLADRYGWDERGAQAYELALEFLRNGKALQIDTAEFVSMLNARLIEKRLRPLHRIVTLKECFDAIKSVYEGMKIL